MLRGRSPLLRAVALGVLLTVPAIVSGAPSAVDAQAASGAAAKRRTTVRRSTPSKTQKSTPARSRTAARTRPRTARRSTSDEVTRASVHRGCVLKAAFPDRVLVEAGLPDEAFQRALLEVRSGADDIPASESCVPYAWMQGNRGAMQSLALHLSGAEDGGERLLFLSRTSATAPVTTSVERVNSALRGLVTVTLPLGGTDDVAIDAAADMPEDTRYAVAALVPPLRKGLSHDPGRYTLRLVLLGGSGAAAGRLQAVELLDTTTSEVLRQTLWVEREGMPGGFFAPDGTSYEQALWTSPVDFTRISRGVGSYRRRVRRRVRQPSGRSARVTTTVRAAHKGIDFAADIGEPVVAVADGVVIDVGVRGAYGNLIVLEHAGGVTTRYAHLSAFAPDLQRGATVRRGRVIGAVGSTGRSTGPHLHFEIRRAGAYIDPFSQRATAGLWSIRPGDTLPMLRQVLLVDAGTRREGVRSAAGAGDGDRADAGTPAAPQGTAPASGLSPH